MSRRKLRKGKRLHGYGSATEGFAKARGERLWQRRAEGVCRRRGVQTERKVRKEAKAKGVRTRSTVRRKPYKKPTQVNERGRRKGLQRIILKELGQMTP